LTERKLTKKSVEIFPATGSAVDDIVSRIRALISERGYGVGDSLPTERELCEAFGTSRNTVREAMRILKAYGIVEVRTKVGATLIDNRMSSAFEMFSFNLMDISRDTFADIQGFRCLLEVSSVEQIFDLIHRTDTDALREINDGFLKKCSVDEAAELDFKFHTRLISVLDNKAMLDVYSIMKPVILRIMKTGKSRHTFETATYSEHLAIVEALESRDRVAYQYRMKTHLEAGFAYFNQKKREAEQAKE
jgi:DNA-binding FadR family transcriptional regulator